MAGQGWTVAIVLVIAVGVGAGAFIAYGGEGEPEEVFCTAEEGPYVAGPAGWPNDGMIVAEDHSPAGEDPCDYPTDGSWSEPVVRGDDCTIAYPDDWPEAEQSHTSVEPFGVGGTCWYALDEE